GVVTQHARRIFLLRLGCAHLGVDRVDRNRFDADQQVAPAGLGAREFEVEQGLRIVDGQVAAQADRLHGAHGEMSVGVEEMATASPDTVMPPAAGMPTSSRPGRPIVAPWWISRRAGAVTMP